MPYNSNSKATFINQNKSKNGQAPQIFKIKMQSIGTRKINYENS